MPEVRIRVAVALIACVLLAGCGSDDAAPVTTTTALPPPIADPALRLVFADEFDGEALDRTKWETCYPYGEVSCTNAGNNELQLYVPDGVSVRDGKLRLTASEPARPVANERGQSFQYMSGMVTTGPEATNGDSPPKFKFQYGYAEARVKVPKGKGLWPAFWLLPTEDPWPPEIDILEVLGDDVATAHFALHWEKATDKTDDDQKQFSADDVDLSADFHTFGADWQPDSVTWYRDGVEVASYTEHIPQEPMYALLNLAVGGTFPGDPNASTPFPSTYEVDWVRIWQR